MGRSLSMSREKRREIHRLSRFSFFLFFFFSFFCDGCETERIERLQLRESLRRIFLFFSTTSREKFFLQEEHQKKSKGIHQAHAVRTCTSPSVLSSSFFLKLSFFLCPCSRVKSFFINPRSVQSCVSVCECVNLFARTSLCTNLFSSLDLSLRTKRIYRSLCKKREREREKTRLPW